MKIALFLGAGASVPLGFPDTKTFKDRLVDSLKARPYNYMREVLEKSTHNDIEDILTSIDKLLKLPLNQGYNLLQNIFNITYEVQERSDQATKSMENVIEDFSTYKQKIQEHIYNEYAWKTDMSNLQLYRNIINILHKSDDGVHIFTTNYDQIMEHCIDENNNGLIRVDGFKLDERTRKLLFTQDSFSENPLEGDDDTKCYLYKLHGSLNWIQHNDKIRQREENEEFSNNNFVIYPTHIILDDQYKQEPFTTLFEKFQYHIETSDIFIVIGYSFRDEQITARFKEFLKRNNTHMFVISPSAQEDVIRLCAQETACELITAPTDLLGIEDVLDKYKLVLDDEDLSKSSLAPELSQDFPELFDNEKQVHPIKGRFEDVNDCGLLDIFGIIFDALYKTEQK